MSDSTTISVRIGSKTKARLSKLAVSTKRSQAFLAAQAIEDFVDLNEWQVSRIGQAIADADSGGPFARHEDVKDWLSSWGESEERPLPKAKVRRP